jgi:hypothetical protein
MTPSLTLVMLAILLAVAALVIAVGRSLARPSTQLSHAMAQLGVVRLKSWSVLGVAGRMRRALNCSANCSRRHVRQALGAGRAEANPRFSPPPA